MTDEELRAAYASAIESPRSPDRDRCPTPDALIALVRRQGAEAARLKTLDHTMSCPACLREFELLRAIDAGERREAGANRAPARWQRPVVLALAASLLLAVGLGPGRDWLGDRTGETMRGDADEIGVHRPAAGAEVSRDSLDFAWRPVPGATRYTVELLSPDGAVRLSGTTTDTTIALRPERGAIEPGGYRWWVRADLPGGERQSVPRAVILRRE